MDNVLCIETSNDLCSVAVAEGRNILSFEAAKEPLGHASHITGLIESCLSTASITFEKLGAVAVSEGPGSYTGLRVGCSAAKAICFALDIPLIAIDTLKSLATASRSLYTPIRNTLFCPMLDARRMEVYCALYDKNLEVFMEPSALILSDDSFNTWIEQGYELILAGNGSFKVDNLRWSEYTKSMDLQCSAKHMVELAEKMYVEKDYSDARLFAPKYLKPPNITKPRKVI